MAKNFAREANILDPLETAYSMIAELTGTSVTDARMQLEEYALRQNPQVQQMPEAEREQYIAKEKADLADYFSKTQPAPTEEHSEVETEVAPAALPNPEGSRKTDMRREAIGSSGIVGPEMYSDKSILALENEAADPRWIQDPKGRDVLLAQIRDAREAQSRMKAEQMQAANVANMQTPAQNPMSPVGPAALPSVAPGAGIMSVGALSMFNSPENLKRIADLLSKAESGLPIESIMEEIRVATGLSGAEFWKALGDLNKTAGENPFADKGDDEKGDKADDKDDKKDAPAKGKKGVNPFEKKDDAEEDESEDEEKEEGAEDKKESEEPKEKSEKKEPKAESKEKSEKEEPEEEKKSKSEIKREKKKEKDEAKLLKEMLNLGEKLLKLEKGEDEAHVAELKNAIEILKDFSKEEKEEPMGLGLDAPSDDMAMIEKTGPDLPPAMEGLALPLPEPEMGMEGPGGMKVIDLAPPVKPLVAAEDKGIGFKKHDRVWRKADAEGGFETIGDEPGRIIEFGEGKAIVDWGHEDGIPTEESLDALVLAQAAGVDSAMFSLPKQSAWVEVEPMNPAHGAMGGEAEVEMVLRETSLHDILARNAKEDFIEEGTIKHLASGKNGKILQRLAGGQLRVSVDGKELVLWPYEVE